jgi:hypothetical protein
MKEVTMSLEQYRQFLMALEKTKFEGKYMPYDWGGLPKQLTIDSMPYGYMFEEFSREIANSINDITNYTHWLKAWGVTLSSMANEDKFDVKHEFVDPLATVALTLPYVIRSRFIFAVAHLCHQANRSRDGIEWKDDLPLDDEIYFDAADRYGANWKRYSALKVRIEKINDKSYQTKTHNFRHVYNHRFSPQVVLGLTQLVTRQVDAKTKSVTYAFGVIPAFTLEVVAGLLSAQCKYSYAAFEAFQKLIREHEVSIAAHH